MTAAAFVLEAVFVGVALVGRMLLQLWKTGDAGFRLSSSMPIAARVSSGLMTLGSVASGVAPALVLLRWSQVHDSVPTVVRGVGVAILAVGIAIALWSQLVMGSSWRIGVDERERTDLVQSGPFTVVRNPIFSAMVLASVGVALAVPTALAVAGAIAVIVGVETQVRIIEEPYLLRTHGRVYADYTARVGRFVPAIGRSRRSLKGP